MPISNLQTTSAAHSTNASHSSAKVKDEYDAKHEAGVAGKMASVWETKTNTLDGGKLPDLFGKDPRAIAAEKKSAKSPPHKETHDVDAGPRQEGPVATKKRSVVEMKSAFESMAEKEKRDNDKKELERKAREDNSTLSRGKSGGGEEHRTREDGNGISRAKSGASDEERTAAAATIQSLEMQITDLSDTVAKLRRELKL